ncbi:histidine phosphatase family protein, partial [Streptomyces sp. SID10244]|nr:histidine phosphatase family protein [Streptomyces sp. SID10244]
MLVITAGRTGPNRSVRFGGDLSLDGRGRRDVAALATSVRGIQVVIGGPEKATRESCELLAAGHAVDDRLATLDVGNWSGRTPEDIDPADLRSWFSDPSARPHRGEAIVEFVERVHRWRVDAD